MVKQVLIYLLLSILVVLFANYVHLVIVYIDMFYTYINVKLTPIFSQSGLGILIRKVLLITFIPALLAGIPASIYWLIKGRTMPHLLSLTWCLWLIIVLSNVLIR